VLSAQPIDSGVAEAPVVSEPLLHQNMAASMTSAPVMNDLSMPSQTAIPPFRTSPNSPDPYVQASRGGSSPAEVPGSPPRTSEGNFVCTVIGCNCGRTFNRRSDRQ
jgi:hypothetical protein